MTGDSQKRAASEPATARERWLRVETALVVAGVLVAAGFALPWFESSGLELALGGGAWAALFAIPALGLLTAVFALLRWRASRYTGWATAIALLVPAAVALAAGWPWLYTVPVIAGVAVIALGVLKRGQVAAVPLGVAMLAAIAIGWWLSGDEPLMPDRDAGGMFGLALAAAIPLLALAIATAVSGGALIVTGLRKKGRERALVIAGKVIVGVSAYVAALDGFGDDLASSGIGLWMTALGGALLLLLSRPLASRKGEKADKPVKPVKPVKNIEKKVDAKVETKEPAVKPDVDAEKAAKIEKLKKLQKLKELKEQEAREAKEAKAAEAGEAEVARAGAALASEPEPAFVSDLSAPPPPENEDREALMKRVGVKKPPPPSESELEAMLAALKSKTSEED